MTMFGPIAADHQLSMELYGRELAQAIHDEGADVRLRQFALRGRFSSAAGARPILGRIGSQLDRFLAYPMAAQKARAEVNHIIDHSYGYLALFTNPRRTVITFHDAMMSKLANRELATDSYPRLAMMGQKIRLRSLRDVSRVITVSQASRADLLRFTDYPAERVRVIPLGVSDRFLRSASRTETTQPGRTLRLLHVGHCGPYKNIERLLHSLPLIKLLCGTQVTLLKAGLPFTRRQSDLIVRLGLEETVSYLGIVPDSELPALYTNADVLLMPSLYEGFGLPVLEAMACGTPVVAANAGALPETAGGAALLVDPLDVGALASAVARVAHDAELRIKLRRRGLRRARLFTWRRTASATLAVYREVAEEARSTFVRIL